MATQKMAERLEEKAANIAQGQELAKAKDEIIDLNEKLNEIEGGRTLSRQKQFPYCFLQRNAK